MTYENVNMGSLVMLLIARPQIQNLKFLDILTFYKKKSLNEKKLYNMNLSSTWLLIAFLEKLDVTHHKRFW